MITDVEWILLRTLSTIEHVLSKPVPHVGQAHALARETLEYVREELAKGKTNNAAPKQLDLFQNTR